MARPHKVITKKPDPTIPFESKYLENDHEAIVSRSVWDAVQRKLEENKAIEEVVGHRGGQPHFSLRESLLRVWSSHDQKNGQRPRRSENQDLGLP